MIVVDEVGFMPLSPGEANLFFGFVSSMSERTSLIITSNKDIASLGQLVGDKIVSRIVGLCGQKNLLHITGKDRRLG